MQPNMKMIQQMQARIEKIQAELEETIVVGTAGGGAVRVEANGLKSITAVKIEPAAVDPDDVEMLEDMILTATNEAFSKAEELAGQKMGALTGGLNIPGLM